MLSFTLSNLFMLFHAIHVFIPPFQNSSLALFLSMTSILIPSWLCTLFCHPNLPFLLSFFTFSRPTTRISFLFSPLSDVCLACSFPAHCIPKANTCLLLQALNTFSYQLAQKLRLLFTYPLSLAMMHETFPRLIPVSPSTVPLSFRLSLEPGKVSITFHHPSLMKNTDNSKRMKVNVSHPRVRVC